MSINIDSSSIVSLFLLAIVIFLFVMGLISSLRLVKALENEANYKNRY